MPHNLISREKQNLRPLAQGLRTCGLSIGNVPTVTVGRSVHIWQHLQSEEFLLFPTEVEVWGLNRFLSFKYPPLMAALCHWMSMSPSLLLCGATEASTPSQLQASLSRDRDGKYQRGDTKAGSGRKEEKVRSGRNWN